MYLDHKYDHNYIIIHDTVILYYVHYIYTLTCILCMFMIPVNILPKNVLLRCRCEHQPRKEYDIEARICPTKNYSLKAAAARCGRPQDAVYHNSCHTVL